MATAIQKQQAKFKKGQKVKFDLGRKTNYTGKVIGKEDDGYLKVEFAGKSPVNPNAKFTRRISPFNTTPVASK